MASSVLEKSKPSAVQGDPTFEKAIRLLENFLNEHPKHAEAHSKLGLLLHRRGDKTRALEEFKHAAEYGPTEFAYLKTLGDYLYVEAKQPESALAAYTRALALKPEDTDTLHLSGNISLALGKKFEARKFYESVLKREPWNTAVRKSYDALSSDKTPAAAGEPAMKEIFHDAQASASMGNDEETNALLDRILRHKSEQQHVAAKPTMRYQEIQRLLSSGKDDEASAALREYLDVNQNNALAHNDFAVLCYRRGDMQEAVQHYEAAVRLDPQQNLYRKNLADFYHAVLGRTEDALRLYIEMFKKNARDTEILVALVNICLSQDLIDDAKFFCQKLVEVKPWEATYRDMLRTLSLPVPEVNDIPATYRRARSVAEAGEIDEASALYQGILQREPNHALSLNDLGTIALMKGDVATAAASYEKAVAIEPTNATFQKNLAEVYHVKLGRTEDALRIYVELLRKNPADTEVLVSLGAVCRAQGLHDDARGFFEKALEIDPQNTAARQALL